VTVFLPGKGCYRCLYPAPPPPGAVPNCAEAGVFGVVTGLVGAIQATEVIKLILGLGEPLAGRLLLIDTLAMDFRTVKLRRNPNCPVCGDNPTITELIDYEAFCGVPIHEHEVRTEFDITPQELKAMLERDGRGIVLLDVREPHEWEICRLEGAILIPLRELPAHLNRLDPTREYVVYCKTGARSAQAARIMQAAGLRVRNLRGGINAWSREVDPNVPLY
ncbi:rhodanese-like domain-containing protein, partial [Thermoflexus hugenholtzii]